MSRVLISNELEAEFLASSLVRKVWGPESVHRIARHFHIPMQEIRIGFREYDEAHTRISLEQLEIELGL